MRFGFFRDRLCDIRMDNVIGYEVNPYPTTSTPSAPLKFNANQLVTELNISKKAAWLLTNGGTLTLTEDEFFKKLKENENKT